MAAKKLDIIQGSPQWHAERRLRIGSSDAPVLMKASPWATPYELYLQKLGLKPHRQKKNSNFAIELGRRFEPAARALYELISGLDFEPVTFTSDEICPRIASLDGWNELHRINLEIKCVQGGPTWEKALSGKVSDVYIPQIHHQMNLADAKETHFLVCRVGKASDVGQWVILDHQLIIVPRDESYEKDLMVTEKGFSQMLRDKTPPPLSDSDVMVADDQSTVLLFSRLKTKKLELQKAALAEEVAAGVVRQLKDEFDEVKQEAIDHVLHDLGWHRVHAIGVDLKRDKSGKWSVIVNDNNALSGEP